MNMVNSQTEGGKTRNMNRQEQRTVRQRQKTVISSMPSIRKGTKNKRQDKDKDKTKLSRQRTEQEDKTRQRQRQRKDKF
jgi:hypothetical protein